MKKKIDLTKSAALILLGMALLFSGCNDSSGGGNPPDTAPTAPAAPTVTAAAGQLTVSWTAVSGATAYEVWYGTANDSSMANKFGNVIGTTTILTGLDNNTTYYVWVKAKNSVGTSGFSASASGTPTVATTAPATPAAPTVTAADGQLTVSWAAVSGATAYEVWYGTADDSSIANKFGNEVSGTTTILTGLTNNTTYYVWVKAKNSVGTSDFSLSANGTPTVATTAPATPAAPTVSAGNAQLSVTWTTVSGATAYEVWYGTASDGTVRIQFGGDITSGTSATITGLTNGTTYYVWVKAKNSVGTSGFSLSANGTPTAGNTVPSQLDSKLPGTWQLNYGSGVEKIVITNSPRTPGNLGSFTYLGGYSVPAQAGGYDWGGDIVYTQQFDNRNGVIIIQYWTGEEQTWFSLNGQKSGKSFTGVYYSDIIGDGSTGTTAQIYSTSDLSDNYGPTDTETLDQAIDRFTQDNKNRWISSNVGDPQTKVTVPAVPAAPTVSAGNAQLSVTWTTVSGATAYEVWYGTASNGTGRTQFGGDITSGTSATITGLTNGTTYYVWMKAKNSAGTSDFSPSTSGMPTAPTSSTGSLNITVGFDSGNITVKNGSTDVSTGFTLSRNGTATATLTSEGSYTSVTWYVDGTAQSGNTLNLDAASLNIRTHSVTFTGTRDGLLYSSRPISVVVTN